MQLTQPTIINESTDPKLPRLCDSLSRNAMNKSGRDLLIIITIILFVV
jgi:hypothetical protein